jgi:hypothetical protein
MPGVKKLVRGCSAEPRKCFLSPRTESPRKKCPAPRGRTRYAVPCAQKQPGTSTMPHRGTCTTFERPVRNVEHSVTGTVSDPPAKPVVSRRKCRNRAFAKVRDRGRRGNAVGGLHPARHGKAFLRSGRPCSSAPAGGGIHGFLEQRDHAQRILEGVAADLSALSPGRRSSPSRRGSPSLRSRHGKPCPDPRRPAGEKRVRHLATGFQVPCFARQRPLPLDGACPATAGAERHSL